MEEPDTSGSRHAFWRAFYGAPIPMALFDDDRRCIHANQSAVEFLGISADDLIGDRLEDFTGAAARELIEPVWAEFAERGSMAGTWPVALSSGEVVEVRHVSTRDALPGLHLSVMFPPGFGAEETGAHRNASLTRSEREVLEQVGAPA